MNIEKKQLAIVERVEGSHIWTNVETKEDCLPWQAMGLTYTASGYGHKIPTTYKVKHNNRWKRVYCRIFGNCGMLYIVSGGDEIAIDEGEEI
mgnify:CR=1 FL=1|tara:strand:- start:617 stop:892 length:276 start_codon:yes stop_codon:yes gene_type:complete